MDKINIAVHGSQRVLNGRLLLLAELRIFVSLEHLLFSQAVQTNAPCTDIFPHFYTE